MSGSFVHEITADAVEIRLLGPRGPIPAEAWALTAPTEALPGVDLAQRLIAAGSAITEGDTLFVEHATIAGLSGREAALIGLPSIADVVAVIETHGIVTQPSFAAGLRWQRPNGQAVIGAGRTGAFLRIGQAWFRLPDILYQIAEAVDRLASLRIEDVGARLAAISALAEVLPHAGGAADAPNILGKMTIAVAEAFSVDLLGEGNAARLVPILHRRGGDPEAKLLSAAEQDVFGLDQFNRFETARSVYTIGGGKFLVLAPPLRRALAEVRRLQSAPLATKRAFVASPRAFLRSALGEETDGTLVESVFRETAAYSERVVGLGLWSPRVLPWIVLPTTDWFGPEVPGGPPQRQEKPPGGLVIGDRRIPLDPAEADALRVRIEDAIGAGRPVVSLDVGGETIAIPANHEVLGALQQLENQRLGAETRTEAAETEQPKRPEALLILQNEQTVELEGSFRPRVGPSEGLPSCLSTPLKPHQAEGLEWLQKTWLAGRPGVLLADDMGLGKTLQALSFLAWLREAMAAGTIARAPVLIVAPTGLLENWRGEHDRHLRSPGLGFCCRAYGRNLAEFRHVRPTGEPALQTDRLAAADWVLTTYETLRDYDRSFGQVRFAVALFDEAQKIKTPGIRLTDAAKAMNADFRIAMSGTPVENRLADLWCIIDGVHPACLGDLKSFSAEYERTSDADTLRRLKGGLERWQGGRPPLLLRRLTADRLPDLPPCEEAVTELAMPAEQADAYNALVASARGAGRKGAVLEALQALRRVCLHPDPDQPADDQEFISKSARLRLTFQALDSIADRGERALIFLDDLALQARLVGIIQRRYRLPTPPMVINGEVAGASRQARVDRFQAAPHGFDVMILSPRAGGVGLTLTSANHVIHLARWWNPAVEDQCTGRVLRIGQRRPVTVHVPLAVLDESTRSFDQNLHALLERKRRLMREALMPPAATEADRDELLSATLREPAAAS
ncbi:MAG TPA: DEAD/DEAH box helicase [Stellaceae bacterium]|nr:DEAD/DEAH box helicase [Stellaceae bacterium]